MIWGKQRRCSLCPQCATGRCSRSPYQ